MVTKLRQYFPMIRTREEVIHEIQSSPKLKRQFNSWKEKYQEEFLDFCTGVKGVKILYDSFFKEVVNPEYTPERLEGFLSLLMKQPIKIVAVLPNDSVRLADEMSLLVTDIIVELADGSLVNLEIQKLGYAFPGQRASCYNSDALLRQYKRIRGEKGDTFSYRDIKQVYLIVLFENSPKELKEMSPAFFHNGEIVFDTGLQINMLGKYIFVALDIFKKTHHNKDIRNELEAWLTFLCSEEPETIAALIDQYPEFRKLYEDIYNLCLNMERVMEMFSRELLELDRNTVRYMIDEMQSTIDKQKKQLEENDIRMKEANAQLKETSTQLEETNLRLQTALEEIERLKKEQL